MKDPSYSILTLLAEWRNSRSLIQRFTDRFDAYLAERVNNQQPGFEQALAVSQMLAQYYTALETVFLRVSQFFENSLPADKWHRALLDKMVIEIDNLRPAVLREATRLELSELLKFRHFSRYYFELEYDWDKLHFLIKKYRAAKVLVEEDLANFERCLESIADSSCN